ncbi:MAG: xylulokinase [Deltaproteobacteria bacterium]|jgi:xylulokinase|nr:xylulokinase [Deltaproteobacteria bacterium]
MTDPAYLGLDLGTTGVKGLVVGADGKTLARLERPLKLSTPKPAWAEQDPEQWWEAALGILKSVPKKLKIARIGLSGQMHTLVPLGGDLRPLRPAILWCDQRSHAQCQKATEILGGEGTVIALTGNPLYPGFTLPKILWLRDSEPDVYKRLKTVLIAKDYLAMRLTGEIGSEPSDASGSSMLDAKTGEWCLELMDKLGLPQSILPALTKSEAARGRLTEDLAGQLGWDRIEVASGGADNAVSALGLGITGPGDCMVSIGTSGTVLGVAGSGASPDPSGRLHFFRHAVGGSCYHMGVMLSAAAALNWAKDKLAKRASWPLLESQMAGVPAGADGLLFLPYLQGERTPHRDPDARGVLFGLSSLTDAPRILRAVIEGVTFGLRDSFELLKSLTEVKSVIVAGGGAKNQLWREILAANLKTPVTAPLVDEGGAYGAAMLAALGDGAPLSEIRAWAGRGGETPPNPELSGRYDALYQEFKALYGDLAQRFKKVAALQP